MKDHPRNSSVSHQSVAKFDSKCLEDKLMRMDGCQYGFYKDLCGTYTFHFPEAFELSVVRVQSDAFAPPSQFTIRISCEAAGIPPSVVANKTRCVAFADFVSRQLWLICRETNDGIRHSREWKGSKGCEIYFENVSQHVLERTNLYISSKGSKFLVVKFCAGLPAHGRTIEGRRAHKLLMHDIPKIVERGILWRSLNMTGVEHHLRTIEDQNSLRAQLETKGLVAFIVDGAILPRQSGDNDRPLDPAQCVPFVSPEELRQSIELPHRGIVSGMVRQRCGIPLYLIRPNAGYSTRSDCDRRWWISWKE